MDHSVSLDKLPKPSPKAERPRNERVFSKPGNPTTKASTYIGRRPS